MREMKDSGVAWIGEIPKDWKIRKISSVVPIITDYVASGSFADLRENVTYLNEPDYAMLVRTADLSGTRDNTVYINKHAYDFLSNSNLFGGEVILSNIGSVGNVFQYFPMYERASLAPNAIMLNGSKCNRYIYYWFLCPITNEELKRIGSSSVQLKFNKTQLKQMPIIYPPIETQHQIAAYLDQKCTQIDALITNQQKQIEKLKAYKQSLITETVTKGLNPDVPMKDSGVEWIGEIPEDWEIVRIKNICQFNPSSKKSFSDDDIVSYAPMECVRTGSLVHKEIAIKNVSSGLTYFEENDIIMAKVTPFFENGNIAIATGLTKGMAFGSSELFVFRANESIKFFLFYFLQNNIFKKFSISTMTGTGGLKRVSSNFVNNYSFALPPIEERNKIVFYLDKKCTQIDSLIAIKQRKIEKLQQYKKSVIYEYVTGKKEVK